MKIQFYNSLTNDNQEFKPIEPGIVRMYSCGPTVYDFAHIGNFRSFLFGDLLRRFFELVGYEVDHVMNITDVGHMVEGEADKMMSAAQRLKENKKSGRIPEGESVDDPNDPYQIAEYFTKAFLSDAKQLGYKIAYEYPEKVPHATNYIQGMQDMIARLLERGHAYVAEDGVVYFSVESFPRYGQLSGNSIDRVDSGAGGRVSEENQSRKKHPADFMLWKPDSSHIMKWDSPWGVGYPGWHIECSVMAREILGRDVIDIHTGGEDLIFPHHECEIAQSCCANGTDSFANFWIHARFLFVEGEKMSKSLGNFYTARDVFQGNIKIGEGAEEFSGKPVHPAVLRYELIKTHYRSNMNFTYKGLTDSAVLVQRIIDLRQKLEAAATSDTTVEVDLTHPILKQFAEALADDLNISGALGIVNPWVRGAHPDADESLAVLKKINSVLAIAPINEGLAEDVGNGSGTEDRYKEAEGWCKELDLARKEKDFDSADAIRKKIIDAGFEVQTTSEGTVIKKKLV
ncbi:cysteine--tRNA ligase [bacterium]|nr:cysteine--tRNA ligase [bacterium]